MKRGDLVTVALPGDYGKPRPALIIQSDQFAQLDSVTVALLTSDGSDSPLFRVDIKPTLENGLKKPSQILLDKAMTVPRFKAGNVIGRVDGDTMLKVDRAIALFFGIA